MTASHSVTRTRFVIAGGGTAGHVEPGLAVCSALVERGVDTGEILWVGSRRGMEARSVAAAGIPLRLLGGRGIERRLSLQNVVSVVGLLGALFSAFGMLARRRPDVVMMLGGYASVAAGVSAVLLRIPLVVAEQNARAGAANRLVGRFARACAVPSEMTDLPRPVLTGNPVRAGIVSVARHREPARARERLGVPAGRTLVAVFSGSLGSRRINEAIAGAVERLADRDDLFVYHVIGRRDFDTFRRPDVSGHAIGYRDLEYEEQMATLLEAADLVISRSGGSTVAELAAIGVASVLVPLPIAPRDHQRFNATMLGSVGAAILLDDGDCTPDRLAVLLAELGSDPGRLATMGAAARGVGRPDAAGAIADLLLATVRPR